MAFDIEVREHRREELRTLIAVAARAFWDDPLFNFFVPDLLNQHRQGSGYFSAMINDCAAHGVVWGAYVDGKPVGVAALLPPGVPIPHGGVREAKQLTRVAPPIIRSAKRMTAIKLFTELPKHHPTEEHWLLSILAADPRMQGRGVGTRLLELFLKRCDSEGLPMYLETQKEANLAYYGRFGFVVREVVQVANSPRVWTMMRSPSDR